MLNKDVVGQLLKRAMSTGCDFAEIYEEDILSNNFSLTQGNVDNIISGRSYGIGIRIIKGLNSIYAYTTENSLNSLLLTADQVAQALDSLGVKYTNIDINLSERLNKNVHPVLCRPSFYLAKKKIEIMKNAYKAARDVSPLISQVMMVLGDSDKQIMIANSEGLYTQDRKSRVGISINSIASYNNESHIGSEFLGRLKGYEFFDEIDVESYAKSASDTAIAMVKANNCPAGIMPIAIENSFGGIIFHEACGHSLESSVVSKGNSVFAGKIGKQIASSKVTAVDDGTIPNGWGSSNIDDEGTPSQKSVLIENGMLKSYMVDRLSGRRMGIKSTGNARRESYKYSPTSRMTNTYIVAGNDSRESIFKSINNGLYAKKLGGGSVNTITGEFNFSVREGYLVKNGEIQEPIKGASLIGKGYEVLMDIDMVSDNLEFGAGHCNSSSGIIHVNVGQPLIRVSKMIVGGKK